MRRIPNLRSIDPISYRPLRPGFRSAISQAMKRAIVVIACCCAVLIDLRTALADSASDRDMANRYEQSAQAGDDDAQFYLGALYSAGVGRAAQRRGGISLVLARRPIRGTPTPC